MLNHSVHNAGDNGLPVNIHPIEQAQRSSDSTSDALVFRTAELRCKPRAPNIESHSQCHQVHKPKAGLRNHTAQVHCARDGNHCPVLDEDKEFVMVSYVDFVVDDAVEAFHWCL